MNMEDYMSAALKGTILSTALLLVSAIFSYANGSSEQGTTFDKIRNKDWNLEEVKNRSAAVIIDRTKAQREIYSVRFEDDLIRGRGAANVYFAPYSAEEDYSISIGIIAGTRMAPIYEMGNFREYEYFRYLERAYRWEFHDWRLKLSTYDESGNEATLEFIPIYK
jgi:hypothetical protein